jgi:hypothetical protein
MVLLTRNQNQQLSKRKIKQMNSLVRQEFPKDYNNWKSNREKEWLNGIEILSLSYLRDNN